MMQPGQGVRREPVHWSVEFVKLFIYPSSSADYWLEIHDYEWKVGRQYLHGGFYFERAIDFDYNADSREEKTYTCFYFAKMFCVEHFFHTFWYFSFCAVKLYTSYD